MKTKKIKAAVTGGIGGGKSSFCAYLEGKGYPVFRADDISKEILIKNKEIQEKIIKAFGKESYINGKLNNKYLAEKVFSNPNAVKKINSIVHPEVIAEINVLMNQALKKNKIVFVEAALIYEASMEEMFDYVIVVSADEDIKKTRLMERGISLLEYEKRTENQIPEDKKRKKADIVFENNGSLEELHQKAEMFLRIFT